MRFTPPPCTPFGDSRYIGSACLAGLSPCAPDSRGACDIPLGLNAAVSRTRAAALNPSSTQDSRHVRCPAAAMSSPREVTDPLATRHPYLPGPLPCRPSSTTTEADPHADRVLDEGSGLRGRRDRLDDPRQPLRGRTGLRRHDMVRVGPRARLVRPLPARVHGAAARADGSRGVRLEEGRLLGHDRATRDMCRMAPEVTR